MGNVQSGRGPCPRLRCEPIRPKNIELRILGGDRVLFQLRVPTKVFNARPSRFIPNQSFLYYSLPEDSSNIDALRNLRWQQKFVRRPRLVPLIDLRFDLDQLLLELRQVILNDRVGEVIVAVIAQSRVIHRAQ